jgi:hypothetical protein
MATPPAPAPQPQPAVTHPNRRRNHATAGPQVVAQPTPQPVVAQPTPQLSPRRPQPAPQVAPQPIVPPPQPAPQPIPVPQLFTFMTLPDQQTGILVNQYTVEQFLSTEGQSNTNAAEINGQAVTLRCYYPAEATSERAQVLRRRLSRGRHRPLSLADAPGGIPHCQRYSGTSRRRTPHISITGRAGKALVRADLYV